MIKRNRALFLLFLLALALPVMFTASARAATQYLNDGALQNGVTGGWDLPPQGTCPADVSKKTRPDCLSVRFPSFTTSGTCNSTTRTFTNVCTDKVNTTQSACQSQPDRFWNSGVCAIVLIGDDRNTVACAAHGGTYEQACAGLWVMPARTAYDPALLTGTGPGDQCLRCHNDTTLYNNPRLRDVEDFLRMGHKNMARPSKIGKAWGGPPFNCSLSQYNDSEEACDEHGGTWDPTIYPSDDAGNTFNWTSGQVTYPGPVPAAGSYDIAWIYGDWLASLPRVIAKLPASTSTVCSDPRGTAANCVSTYGGTLIKNAGASYSCARCHTTGWTSDAQIQNGTNGQLLKEPEKSFPGITWPRLVDATAGLVNLSGGVSNDPNKYSSWDVWGIGCTRCHNSAIDTLKPVAGSSPTQYSAPDGMSSHHNLMTGVDAASGYCTDTRFTAQTQCDNAGAAWLTACSVAGVCSNPAYTTSGTCKAGGGVWTVYDASNCVTNGGTLFASSCSVAGLCSKGSCSDPQYTNKNNCELHGKNWTAITDQTTCTAQSGFWAAATDVITCDDAGGKWTGSKPNRGPIITALCMGCHRQETGGIPYGATTTDGVAVNYSATDPAGQLKVGPYHGSVNFLSHPHANQFLNSPHGEYTGTFDKIALSTFGNGYASQFQNAAEANNIGNGCTGCHEVHKSTVEKTIDENPFRAECTECHSDINLATINHLGGSGTPLEEMGIKPAEACITCHMPGGLHLFRINSSASYSTFPMPAAINGTTNANYAADGSYAKAVWVDVDFACGQCHGGGSNAASTTGNATAGSATITVASSTGFAANQRIRIQKAGSLFYDEEGVRQNSDFDTFIKSVDSPTQITLAGAATTTIAGTPIVQNPTKNGAPYRTKSSLASVAKGMHASAGITYPVTFSYSVVPNTLQVNVDASVSCGTSPCPTFTYDWDWGDATTHGTADPDTHTYATGGSKTIKLTISVNGKQAGTYSRSLTLANPDAPPTASAVCTPNTNNWTLNIVDNSSDDGSDADTLAGDGNSTTKITITWGDGSTNTTKTGVPGGSFNHTFIKAGTFTATVKATDSKLQTSTYSCAPVTVNYFQITGTVKNKLGTLGIGSAAITVKKGTTVVKTVYTASNGTFTVGSLLPATYNFTVVKAGYTFPAPGTAGNPNVTVGPNGTAGVSGVIKATAP